MARGDQVLRQWRLWQILSQATSARSIEELGERLGEDSAPARTLRRDLEVLRELGVPLEVVREGRSVRYAILDDGPPIRVGGEIALALKLAAGLLEPFRGTPIGESLAHFIGRLEGTVSPAAQAHFEALVRGLVVKAAAPASYAESGEVIATLQQAIRERRSVELDYESVDSPRSRRTVEPHALTFAGRGLYLLARDVRAGRVKTFRVERILAAALGREQVGESDFDPESYLRGGLGIFSPEHEPRRFVIRVFSARAAGILRENPWHESQALVKEGRAWRLELMLTSSRELYSKVLALGEEAEVLEPLGFRDEVLRRVHESLRRYRGENRDGGPEMSEVDATLPTAQGQRRGK